MDLVTGALGKLPSKLLELLKDEYKLQTGVKDRIRSGARELESMHAVLRKVAQVPPHELDELVLLWARDVREASYDMEDILDTFLVHVDGGANNEPADEAKVKHLMKKIGNIFSLSKAKARHKIAGAIDVLTKQLEDMAKLRGRYTVDDIKPTSTTSIDPRLSALYTKVTQLVGINEPMNKLIQMLTIGDDDDVPNKETRIVSVVGSGGLGKTTLVKAVYEKLTSNIPVKAFVPVGQKPDLKKVLRDILMALEKNADYVMRSNFTILDERQLIDELRDFLKDRRYVIYHILCYFYALDIKIRKLLNDFTIA
jgi:ATPase subunit of ABC transporter with duplicated ATPase domains